MRIQVRQTAVETRIDKGNPLIIVNLLSQGNIVSTNADPEGCDIQPKLVVFRNITHTVRRVSRNPFNRGLA